MNGEPPPGVGPGPESSAQPSRVIDKSVLPMYQTLATSFSGEGVPVGVEESPEQTNETGQPLGYQDIRVNIIGVSEDVVLFDEGLGIVNGLRNDLKGKLSGIEAMTPQLMEEQIAKGLQDIYPFVAKRAAISREVRLTKEKILAVEKTVFT